MADLIDRAALLANCYIDDEGEWEDTIKVCRDCYDDDYFKPEDKCDGI